MSLFPPTPLMAAMLRSLSFEAKLGAVIVAMVIFGQIPMQMLLCAVLINAAHTAFENGEIAFR